MLRKPGIINAELDHMLASMGHRHPTGDSEWFDREGASMPGTHEERAQQLAKGKVQEQERKR